ncbi:hypothetical protein L6R49_10495 [Myxococcota bacterium]|nr:hypothetical protein [Myxococcota bacterium]
MRPQRVSPLAFALWGALMMLRVNPRKRSWRGSLERLGDVAELTRPMLEDAAYELRLRGLVSLFPTGGDTVSARLYGQGRLDVAAVADPGQEMVWTVERDGFTHLWRGTQRGVSSRQDALHLPHDDRSGYRAALTVTIRGPKRELVVSAGCAGHFPVFLQLSLPADLHPIESIINLGRCWSVEYPALGRLVSMPRCV